MSYHKDFMEGNKVIMDAFDIDRDGKLSNFEYGFADYMMYKFAEEEDNRYRSDLGELDDCDDDSDDTW